ncbi:ABC transporter ATP-binding protein [Bartonella sp. LJL80]
MVLSLENVSFNYPGTTTGVRDISLEIGRGELLAVIGASGSGKTTILRLIAGFIAAQKGSIRINGKDVSGLAPEKRELGVVFQSYSLFPHMRLWENVAYPLKVRGINKTERRNQAVEMLERVGMGHRVDAYPAALSGGQQQRVALARALVFQPLGLLLDEPLSALDAGLRSDMRDEILRVQRAANIATLLVTHDQEEALSIADKVAVMRDGQIVQIGTPHALYETPVNADVAAFVGQSNLWNGKVVDNGLVETSLGIIRCETSPYQKGDGVTVLVRPERIVPTAPSTNPGYFKGHVVADRYLGPIRRVDLKVGEALIKIETHIRDAVESIMIPPEAVRLLPLDKK